MAGGKELKLAISIGGKIDKSLGAAINNAQSQLNKIGKFANKVGMAATGAVVAGATKIVTDSVKTYAEYESALNSAAATAGIEKGSAAYEAMNAAAREAGKTTVKTAKESAEALEYMALAGWSVEDSTKALMPVLKLSAAAGMDLGTTSDLVTDTMAAMGLGINDLGHYLDVLAKGNNSANYNAQELLESYIGVGGVLKNLNVPVEKSAAVLGVMANQGLKGSEAGTALNAILVNMQKQSGDSFKAMQKLGISMYDTNGKTRDLIDVFQEVHDKTAGMTEQQRNLAYQMIGGKAHYEDFAKIMAGFNEDAATGTAQIYDLIKAYEGADGALDKFYDIKTDTLEGSITRLNSAYEGMLLNIGERLAPVAGKAVDNLINKMPQIENTIMSFLETLIPAVSKAIDLLTQNPDKIIKTVTGIAKAFVAFKAIKGLSAAGTLIKDLAALGKFAGLPALLNGVTGALTGMSGGFAAVAAAALPVAGVIAAVAAAVGIGVVAYKAWDKAQNHWGDTTLEQAKALHETASKYKELGAIQKELSGLESTVYNPNASTEEIETAKSRIQEIAGLLEREYNLTINTETAGLDEALSKVESATRLLSSEQRREFNSQWGGYMDTMAGSSKKYVEATEKAPQLQRDVDVADFNSTAANTLYSQLHDLQTTHIGGGSDADYIKAVNELYNQERNGSLGDAIKNQYSWEMPEQITNTKQADDFVGALYGVDQAMDKTLEKAQKTYDQNDAQRSAWLDAQQEATAAISDMLMTDVLNENAGAIEQDIGKFESLAQKMRDVGESTADLETAFAAASTGYETFDAAVAAGKTAEMAENLLKFKLDLGDTAEAAVSSAALVASGFENVEKATAAGADGINSVIASMKEIGSTQGLFDGLDSGGIADKLSDMAHAMNLIPENKTITLTWMHRAGLF